jgi:hypothetical protein
MELLTMNNKLTLVALASLFSMPAMANNAVLNVEGKIQINGTTVIGADGKVASSALPSTTGGNTIKLDKYSKNLGLYTYVSTQTRHMSDMDGNYWTVDYVCTEIENLSSFTQGSYEEICTEDGVEVDRYSGSWIDNQDGTETYSWTYFNGQNNVTETRTVQIDELTNYPSSVNVGAKYLEASTETIIETDSPWDDVGETYRHLNSIVVFTTLPSHNDFADCVVYERGNYYDYIIEGAVNVRCQGVGDVENLTYNGVYKLVDYTPHAAARSGNNVQKAYSAKDWIKSKIRQATK